MPGEGVPRCATLCHAVLKRTYMQVADALRDSRLPHWIHALNVGAGALLQQVPIDDSTPPQQADELRKSLLTFRAAFLKLPGHLQRAIFHSAVDGPSAPCAALLPAGLRGTIAAQRGALTLDIGPLPNPDSPDTPLLPLRGLHAALSAGPEPTHLHTLALTDERFRSIFNPDGGCTAEQWLPHFLGLTTAQPHRLGCESNTHLLAAVLRALPMLCELSLQSVGVTSATLFGLARVTAHLPFLRTLRLACCLDSMHALAGLHAVTRSTPTLRVLHLTWDRHSRAVGSFFHSRAFALRAALAAATRLTSLTLVGTNLFLDRAVSLPSLQSLSLQLQYRLAELRADGHRQPGVAALWAMGTPQLTRLQLRVGTSGGVADATLRALPQAGPDLEAQPPVDSSQAAAESALFPPHGPLGCPQGFPLLRSLRVDMPTAPEVPMGRLAWLRLLAGLTDAAANGAPHAYRRPYMLAAGPPASGLLSCMTNLAALPDQPMPARGYCRSDPAVSASRVKVVDQPQPLAAAGLNRVAVPQV